MSQIIRQQATIKCQSVWIKFEGNWPDQEIRALEQDGANYLQVDDIAAGPHGFIEVTYMTKDAKPVKIIRFASDRIREYACNNVRLDK